MMDGSERIAAAEAALGRPAVRLPGQIGVVIAVSGFKLSCLLFGGADARDIGYAGVQIGALVKVPTGNSAGAVISLAATSMISMTAAPSSAEAGNKNL